MASYAWYNDTTKIYNLGSPLHIVSENTNPITTIDPTFELAYWRFGPDIAEKWKQHQSKPIPLKWTTIRNNLAPFPTQDDVYVLHESLQNPWTTQKFTEDHPSLLGLDGWLPPDPPLNLTIFNATVSKVYETWDFTRSYGWDFPLLALTAARMGDAEKAIEWLLHADFAFDEVGCLLVG